MAVLAGCPSGVLKGHVSLPMEKCEGQQDYLVSYWVVLGCWVGTVW